MIRTEAIAIITATLPKLDDARVADLAELVQAATGAASPFRDLTDEERAGLERSKDDFAAGRIYTPEQYGLEMDRFMARMKAKYPSAP